MLEKEAPCVYPNIMIVLIFKNEQNGLILQNVFSHVAWTKNAACVLLQIYSCVFYMTCFTTSHIFPHKNYRGPVYIHGLTLILAWISNHLPSKVWDEITYPIPNFNGYTVEVWEWDMLFHPTLYNGCN